jgi:3-phosphoshikimate 1-carboxyvinyltransferase
LTVPASKSVTQRYFNLALLGRLPLEVRRPLLSEDTRDFLGGLEVCGFQVERGADAVRIVPGELPSGGEIFCGAGGTMFRFLTAALTAVPGRWRLDGVPRLRERTVAPLLAALRQLGAEITCPEREGFAPLEIRGGTLIGGRATLDAGASSQFLSALLMAAQSAPEPTTVEVAALTSEPYVDLTLDAIAELGGAVERREGGFLVRPSRLTHRDVVVEADFSAAAYPASAAALTGGRVSLRPLRSGSRQGDRRFVDLLERMGARVRWGDGELEVSGGELTAPGEADLSQMPDQVPTLAALAPFARGTTRIVNVPHLRIKESDRLAAMARELTRVGAEVEELEDGLVIPGVWAEREPPSEPVSVATWGDHRIAMSMALVALRRPGVEILDPGVVAKSYPDFWSDLETLIGR